jgi:hypothetical protein
LGNRLVEWSAEALWERLGGDALWRAGDSAVRGHRQTAPAELAAPPLREILADPVLAEFTSRPVRKAIAPRLP